MAKYKTIKLPENMIEEIDRELNKENSLFTSRSDFVKNAVRYYLFRIAMEKNNCNNVKNNGNI